MLSRGRGVVPWSSHDARGNDGESEYVLYNRIIQTSQVGCFANSKQYDAMSSKERFKTLTTHMPPFAYNFVRYWQVRRGGNLRTAKEYLYPGWQRQAYTGLSVEDTDQLEGSSFDVTADGVFRAAHTGHLNEVRLDVKCTEQREPVHGMIALDWEIYPIPQILVGAQRAWPCAQFQDNDAIKIEPEDVSQYYSMVIA